MGGTLSVTFRGPFVFQFQSNTVDVYAPKCDGHFASISWPDKERAIIGLDRCGDKHTYCLSGKGITYNTGCVITKGIAKLAPAPSCAPQTQFAYFHINVPRPKILYRMIGDSAEIVQPSKGSAAAKNNGPTGAFDRYTTALRFYYDWDLTEIGWQEPCYPPGGAKAIPIDFDTADPMPKYGDIEIQYSGPESGDTDHLDAIGCFDQIAALAGVDWWLNYYQGGPTGGGQTRTGSDCHATPLVYGL